MGQRVGLGWQSASCMFCHQRRSGEHNLRPQQERTIAHGHGGFADRVRCDWTFALPLPDTLTFETSGPQFCAGITVFNAMVQFGVKPSDRVGVIGIGGLGHLALQFLNTWAATCMRSVQATGEFRMTARHFIVQKATTFDVASDGTSFRMNFICRDGSRVSLSLPTECLHGFMMTLPQMMRQALRTRGDNESLGLVYPVDNLRIEHSSEPNVFIVTLTMMNGFEASYGLTRQQMMDFDVTDAVERE
jgi:hypothetical protein